VIISDRRLEIQMYRGNYRYLSVTAPSLAVETSFFRGGGFHPPSHSLCWAWRMKSAATGTKKAAIIADRRL